MIRSKKNITIKANIKEIPEECFANSALREITLPDSLESIGTSAFSYVTELASNSIVLSLKKLNERSARFVNRLDFIENINTI